MCLQPRFAPMVMAYSLARAGVAGAVKIRSMQDGYARSATVATAHTAEAEAGFTIPEHEMDVFENLMEEHFPGFRKRWQSALDEEDPWQKCRDIIQYESFKLSKPWPVVDETGTAHAALRVFSM